jgi:hypothetical protein
MSITVSNSNINVLCLDPGINTGWSWWKNGELIVAGVDRGLDEVMETFSIFGVAATHIVYEGFTWSSISAKEQFMTIELCGSIQALAKLYQCEIVKQYPSVRRGYLQFAKKVQTSLPTDVKRHATDSIAHGYKFFDTLRKEGVIEWDRPF